MSNATRQAVLLVFLVVLGFPSASFGQEEGISVSSVFRGEDQGNSL